jgi:hypothetical protein
LLRGDASAHGGDRPVTEVKSQVLLRVGISESHYTSSSFSHHRFVPVVRHEVASPVAKNTLSLARVKVCYLPLTQILTAQFIALQRSVSNTTLARETSSTKLILYSFTASGVFTHALKPAKFIAEIPFFVFPFEHTDRMIHGVNWRVELLI